MHTKLPSQSDDLRFAVLIGVGRYPRVGTHADLSAPVNDIKGWFDVLKHLGLPARNIDVLTSPVLTPAELGCFEDDVDGRGDGHPPLCGPADSETVGRRLERMAARLTAAGAQGIGMVIFVGHGDVTPDRGYPLFLSDCAGPRSAAQQTAIAEDGVLSLARLSERVPAASLVMITDACQATFLDPQAEQRDEAILGDKHLIVAATQAGHRSFERVIDRAWRSQFSWAAQIVLQEWAKQGHGPESYVGISYERLVEKTNELMGVFCSPTQVQRADLKEKAVDSDADARALSATGFFHPFGVGDHATHPYADHGRGHEFGEGTTEFIGTMNDGSTCAFYLGIGQDDNTVYLIYPSGTNPGREMLGAAKLTTQAIAGAPPGFPFNYGMKKTPIQLDSTPANGKWPKTLYYQWMNADKTFGLAINGGDFYWYSSTGDKAPPTVQMAAPTSGNTFTVQYDDPGTHNPKAWSAYFGQ